MFPTYLIFGVFDLIEVCQNDFPVVLLSFLDMGAWHCNRRVIEPPPIWESFAIVKSRKLSLSRIVDAVNIPIRRCWNMKLQRVALHLELVEHVGPVTGIIFVSHEVPINAVFIVGIVQNGSVSLQVNGRLTMEPTIHGTIVGAPFTVAVTFDCKAFAPIEELFRIASLRFRRSGSISHKS